MTSYFPFIFYLVLNSSYNCYAYHSVPLTFRYLACVASASNRVIARKLERERKKLESGRRAEKRKQRFLLSPPPPPSFLFFLLSSQLSRRTCVETLATQATPYSAQVLLKIALFCRQNVRLKNCLSSSKFCRQNLSKLPHTPP